MRTLVRVLAMAALAALAPAAPAAETELNGHRFTHPDNVAIELVAGRPLVERPVSADFDERGRLYVTDSSGSNEPLAVQREKRPHRIVRLEDADGDGVFDKQTVYADRLMFPEGAMWHRGSLYVAAPPEIWKFTDADDDGVAERREVWFDGKTLTHCGNDLHGPYLGPDGWIYWCKGAFAEQTYERPGRPSLKTRAAHVFRRRLEGGPIEAVMTGGMDNPVELAFTPGGERIFTTTFLIQPQQGLRDGLIHAVYGGLYGKRHGAIDGHPRTGDLMPVLDHLGAAAPCGLTRLETDQLGEGFQHQLLATLFNMHKVTRHELYAHGAALRSRTTDLLVSDNLDFHPTDVLEDADGSVLVVDTGGWFRLCCPTSQLEKPDVLGGIYRIRRRGAESPADPRGLHLDWDRAGAPQLAERLADDRFAVRRRAQRALAGRGGEAVGALAGTMKSTQAEHRLHAVWTLTQIHTPAARKLVRQALSDEDETVRQAALHSVSVHRDHEAGERLSEMLAGGSSQNRRAAAEALGRVGEARHTRALLEALPQAMLPPAAITLEQLDGQPLNTYRGAAPSVDRVLEHSLIYAAMEIGDVAALRQLADSPQARVRRGALIALDQLDGGSQLRAEEIAPLLVSGDPLLSETAWWIAQMHPEWGAVVADAFTQQLRDPPGDARQLERLSERLRTFAGAERVQSLILEGLKTARDDAVRRAMIETMAASGAKPPPADWLQQLVGQLDGPPEAAEAALRAIGQLTGGVWKDASSEAVARLNQAAANERRSDELRLRALSLLPPGARDLNEPAFDFVCSHLNLDSPVATRSLAVDLLASTKLSAEQLQRVAQELPGTGVMELRPLLEVFAKSNDPAVGEELVEGLLKSPAASSLLPDQLQTVLAGFGPKTVEWAAPLMERIEAENEDKLVRIRRIEALLPDADARRGLQVFQSTKTSCIACHRRGYLGGAIGPDLNRIGRVRSHRDLLESILFPSLTFVRSYEPVQVRTDDGEVFSGLVQQETDDSITLRLDAQKTVTIPKDSIERRQMGTVSIMPAGLEKQISEQDMADLVKYLLEG